MAHKFHFSAGLELKSVRDKIQKNLSKKEDFIK
jgi:hypothetical protein